MKELKIHVKIQNDKIATLIKHAGFTDNEDYSTEQILETIGILENLKQQMLDKLKSIGAKQ